MTWKRAKYLKENGEAETKYPMYLKIQSPDPFDYNHTLRYLRRSELELLHRVKENQVVKLVECKGEKVLLRLEFENDRLKLLVDPASGRFAKNDVIQLITEWLDLGAPLVDFYQAVGQEPLFAPLIKAHYGMRMVRVPDLFEALAWSIIGQQINLRFAYQVKHQLVKYAGDFVDSRGERHFLFPSPDRVLSISDQSFRSMQFSRQKITYLRNVAALMVAGALCKEQLLSLEPEEAKRALMEIKGIGNWSANYVMMRCLGWKEAFPLEDAGLHQALRKHMNLNQKLTLAEVRRLTSTWGHWKAYRTYYLWQSL